MTNTDTVLKWTQQVRNRMQINIELNKEEDLMPDNIIETVIKNKTKFNKIYKGNSIIIENKKNKKDNIRRQKE